MKVLGKVFSITPHAKKYGEFGIKIQLDPDEFIKLKVALEFEPHIQLAFGYFTLKHLEEVLASNGVCTLVACWIKEDGATRNDGELWDDVKFLESWLSRANWHGICHDLGLSLIVTYYKPLCDKIADGEIHPDDVPDLKTDLWWQKYLSDPRCYEYCKTYGLNGENWNDHYETITDSLGVEWCEDENLLHPGASYLGYRSKERLAWLKK